MDWIAILLLALAALGLWLHFTGRKPEARPARSTQQAAPVALTGKKGDGFDIVGESNYQGVIGDLAGGPDEDGVDCPCDLVLAPEPQNKFDPGAVVVRIDGERVGYIARGRTDALRAELARLGLEGRAVTVPGKITGGWIDEDGEAASFGVRMTIRTPFEVVRSGE